jgi:hypothetical protein
MTHIAECLGDEADRYCVEQLDMRTVVAVQHRDLYERLTGEASTNAVGADDVARNPVRGPAHTAGVACSVVVEPGRELSLLLVIERHVFLLGSEPNSTRTLLGTGYGRPLRLS